MLFALHPRHFVRLFLYVLIPAGSAAVCLIPVAPASATVPPAPGKKFPPAYIEYQTMHPEQFKIRGGLTSWVERARARRLEVTAGSPDRGGTAVSGTVITPVIPVTFTPATAPAPPTQIQIDQILFSGGAGTVTDYFDEVSYGLLNMTGDVFAYTSLPSADTVYEGTNNGLAGGGNTGQLLLDALNLTDPGVDFGLYDNDGPDGMPDSGDDDGIVDLVAFLHPESGGECGNTNIWSHRWTYVGWHGGDYVTDDMGAGGTNIRIRDYTIQGALNCTNAPLEIGTSCHEFGHIFGIPDLYDTDGNSQGLGHWCLMAGGSWQTQTSPAHMSAWVKAELGWITPTLLVNPQSNLAISAVETTAEAFQITIGNGEYFLLENRQALGFDAGLHSCGLVIYHVDQAMIDANRQSNTVNTRQNCGVFVQQAQAHYGIAVEQADGLCQIEANSNRGDAGDVFPGSTVNRFFDENSIPNTNTNAGISTQVAVTNVSNCGDPMTADVEPLPIPDIPSTKIDVVFLIDNTGSYADDYPIIEGQMASIVTQFASTFSDVRFGLAIFRDFPFGIFGPPGDFAFEQRQPLTADTATFLNAVADLTMNQPPGGGGDVPEAQYEALFQTLTGLGRDLDGNTIAGDSAGEIAPSSMGWAPLRHRIVYLLTDADFHDSDTENYPGTTLESIGRNAVRALIATTFPPNVLTLFVLVAENPGAYINQGEDGSVPNVPPTALFTQSEELTLLTGGGVFSVGTDSSGLEDAIDVSLTVLLNSDIAQVPTISEWGLVALVLLVMVVGTIVFRYATVRPIG